MKVPATVLHVSGSTSQDGTLMMLVMGAGQRPQEARRIDLLAGQKLQFVRLDDVVVLGFPGGRQVLIETVARLVTPNGRTDPEPADDDALATLLGDVVRTAEVCTTGELRICFESGTALLVTAHPEIESWAVTGPDGLLLVCLPGGEVAAWGETTTPRSA
jgi:Family of unknown function (DUF6188)